jgi:NAD(P)-dependent dehydrogenase (short-subunit alcohol dehydrogenase family)
MPHRRLVLPLFAALLVLLPWGCGGDAPGNSAGADGVRPAPEGPVALVTGSTDGLGRELALRLAADGMHLIIHGRNTERGAEVVAAIEAAGTGSARFYPADFASLEEVQALADAILRDHDRLDLLVNNAGVGPGAPGHERAITPDGHELRFQVNYLAGYLLTRELLPLLEAGAPSRIVSVTSRNQQPVDFDDLRLDRGYAGGVAYGRSKLAQVLMTMDLAEELEDAGVLAFAVHPAPAMDTNLVLETGSTPQSTVAEGVEAVLQAIRTTTHPTGTFFFELEPRRAHEQAYDPEARRRLREASESMVREALESR